MPQIKVAQSGFNGFFDFSFRCVNYLTLFGFAFVCSVILSNCTTIRFQFYITSTILIASRMPCMQGHRQLKVRRFWVLSLPEPK